MKRLVWIGGLIAAFALPVAAQAVTSAEQHACYPDAVRLCGVKSGDKATFVELFRVGFCLLSHRSELSPRCSAVFASHGR